MRKLEQNKKMFSDFQIIIEATHHGPTALSKPTIFIEIGTTEKQWIDESLCSSVAKLVLETMSEPIPKSPIAICFGSTHYPEKFTKELIHGDHALGTVIPKHSLEHLDEELFSHIISQNKEAKTALLDWTGLGTHKQKVLDMLSTTNLQVFKL
jgi:D-aminoacyl-tRNA deacylase